MTMFKINPGKYKHVVYFQELNPTKNTYGENAGTWINVTKARVGIFPLSGKDKYDDDMVHREITHKIHIRYNPSVPIDSTMRIKFGERIFDIIAPPINFQESNMELQILCKERL